MRVVCVRACVCVCTRLCSVESDSETTWTAAHQAPLSMGFSRQEHWSGLPYLPPGDLPNPGIKLESSMSLALQTDFFFTHRAIGKP